MRDSEFRGMYPSNGESNGKDKCKSHESQGFIALYRCNYYERDDPGFLKAF